tara:strand:+ start:8360 stop:8866 length:507 start_codon:yes stop_codon:yes gene_type:complete
MTISAQSMLCISRMEDFKTWRVALPKGLGGRQQYFNDSDYGGKQAALLESIYYRDDAYTAADMPLHARLRLTTKRKESGCIVPIYEIVTPSGTSIRGYWMSTENGVAKMKAIQRSCQTHGADRARQIVEAKVFEEIKKEATRLAEAEATGTLQLGDGAIGSRRNRKNV